MGGLQLDRDEAWRFAYRLRPYLEIATDEQLQARLADVLRNLYTLTPAGKVGALAPDRGGLLWLQKLLDVELEYRRRDQSMPDAVRPEDFPFDKAALELVRANQHLTRYVQPGHAFCRFGEFKWMRDFVERGEILLSPASYYKGSEHGIARQDNELEIETIVTPYDYDLGTIHQSLLGISAERSWGFVQHQKPCDHYLFCVTVGFDFRYFVDFGLGGQPAAACVVIRDQDAFENRLVAAMRREFPGWYVSFGGAKYVDPYWVAQILPNVGDEIFYMKDFRYMYQGEHRAVALPPDGVEGPFERQSLTIGSLEDMAELVVLASSPWDQLSELAPEPNVDLF